MGVYSKAILAFLALVVTNLLAVVVGPGNEIVPQTAAEWWTAISTTVLGTFAVWWKANVPASLT